MVPYDGNEPVSREVTNDGGTRVKHWSNAVLLHPADKSQYRIYSIGNRPWLQAARNGFKELMHAVFDCKLHFNIAT